MLNPRLFPSGLSTALALLIGAATCVISTLHAADDVLRQPEARFVEFPWQAEWISHPTAPPKSYGVYHFRKAFSLEQQPKSFVIHLSAFDEKASFASSEDSLRQIWEICWRTLNLGAHDLFTDSPYYEQLMYVGDTRIEALTSLYVSGDDRLMRKAIRSFDDCRFPNGLTTSRYPDANQQIIPPYSLVWISMLHDCLIYRNDPEFVKSFLPGMREVLRIFREEADPATGSYIGRKWWNF